MNQWNARRELFTTMPLGSFVTFCLAVAFTFAAIGAVNDLFDLEHSDARHLIIKVLTTSSLAVLLVLFIYRRMPKLLITLAVAEILWLIASSRMYPLPQNTFSAEQWRTHVALHGFVILVLILFSYGWFGTFFRLEGRRYFAAHTEIELASRIQQQLVPPIHMRTENLEIYGISIPSGTVGGDLIDVVDANGVMCAYVADVAGHGVAAGVMMSMVKTAVRMHLMASSPTGTGLLDSVNDTLTPLTDPAAYATFAYILATPDALLTYSVAAHLPVFHFQRKSGAVQRHSVENLPVAMFPHTHYKTAVIDFQPGDVVAIVTDGLTEIFDSADKELGDLYIESTLTRLASLPLSDIADGIFKSANAFGKATDDQTLLLLRRSDS
jgi:hypothetical protein